MRDLYSKVMLTIIALALVAIAVFQFVWVNSWTGWPATYTQEDWEREFREMMKKPRLRQ